MKRVTTIIFSVAVFSAPSCEERETDLPKNQTSKYLLGYWIPQRITWEIEAPSYKDSGRIFETAHFRTICFDATKNDFIYFSSTQRHQSSDNDSIIFAGEPLVTVFGGTWKLINDTTLIVDYKPINWEINPPDKRERHEQIKILFEKDTLLLFEDKLYTRTHKYDKISQQTIEGYKKQYLK